MGHPNDHADCGRIYSSTITRKAFLVALFSIFLTPVSFMVHGNGVSSNYLFLLLPAFVVLVSGVIRLPNQNMRIIVILYVLVFLLAVTYQFSYIAFLERRFISFVIFMGMFVFTLIDIDLQMVQSFKISVVVVSIYMSLTTIVRYFLLGGAELGFAAKGEVGSQRFGFVYILAIWLLIHYVPKRRMLSMIKIISLLFLGSGLLLTFSRSSIVAIVVTLGSYLSYKVFEWSKRQKSFQGRGVLELISTILISSLIILLLHKYFPVTFDFYESRLLFSMHGNGTSVYNLDNQESSEGYRFFVFRKIVDFVTHNPLTGSGYLGVWILFDDMSGSSHNQYFDVLFRTGILGFSAYVFLIYTLLRFLWLREPGLFWGTIGILVYGLAHETFKESQGGFVLAFMLGMMAHFNSDDALDSGSLPVGRPREGR